ncbi:unnamed protein product [Camellia sinensis]
MEVGLFSAVIVCRVGEGIRMEEGIKIEVGRGIGMEEVKSSLNSRRRMEEGYLICFEKELSKTDVTGNLEIPRDALHLPDAAENNEIMLVWDHGKIWNFQAPVRGDGRRRFMSDQWRQFAKDNSLMDRDVLKFYRSTAIVNFYVVTFERALRTLPLFPGAPL